MHYFYALCLMSICSHHLLSENGIKKEPSAWPFPTAKNSCILFYVTYPRQDDFRMMTCPETSIFS